MAAEWICRALRDGALEGEHAPALTIKDSITSPLGFDVFAHVLSQHSTNISAGKSQSRGLVLVAFSRSPSFYLDLLNKKGLDTASSHQWIRILDCYTDPLGWKDRLAEQCVLFNYVTWKGFVEQGNVRFCVAIDSVNEMLRYASLSDFKRLWFYHADLCEERVTAVLDYMSTMAASIEPLIQFANRQRSNSENLSLLDQNFTRGKLHLRCKRRNGRVRVMSGIKFTSASCEDGVINQGLLPKGAINLQLSEKELKDRAKVVLPFEHQGNGKPVQIYDGRKSLTDGKYEIAPKMKCQILMRDPDDDLDI
ncbi:hypothetical protein M0R45_019833 [Rubus argutus]|uniref:Elongator complex protein 5 n=1 Tax=Rubus argutus TaxID=59490 RepID=A0AAW1X6J9_RUBAR